MTFWDWLEKQDPWSWIIGFSILGGVFLMFLAGVLEIYSDYQIELLKLQQK